MPPATCTLIAAAAALSLPPALADVSPGVPPGFSSYRAYHQVNEPGAVHASADMNARGQVVGRMFNFRGEPIYQGFRWSARRGLEPLTDLPGGATSSRLLAINDHGLAVGHGTVAAGGSDYAERALAVAPDGRRVALAHPGEPGQDSVAVDVNAAGVAIGYVADFIEPLYAVRWNADGSVQRLDGTPAWVRAINLHGDIAGNVDTRTGFLHEASGTLHTFPMGVASVNDDGTVAGNVKHEGHRAALWTRLGGIERLPNPADRPDADCYAVDANRRDQAVGYCTSRQGTGPDSAVLWQRIDGRWHGVNIAALVARGGPHPEQDAIARRITDEGLILVDGSPSRRGAARTMVLAPADALAPR